MAAAIADHQRPALPKALWVGEHVLDRNGRDLGLQRGALGAASLVETHHRTAEGERWATCLRHKSRLPVDRLEQEQCERLHEPRPSNGMRSA